MNNTTHNKLVKTITNSLIENLEERNKEAPKGEQYFANMIQQIFYQFIYKNKFLDNENMEKLCKALSSVMELVFFKNAENNYFIKKQRDNVALIFIYMAQTLSIDSLETISDFSSSRNTESILSLWYAKSSLKIVNDNLLKSQIQEIYNNQILHNMNLCAMSDNFKEEFEKNSHQSSQKLYKQLFNSKKYKNEPTEKSAKILSWILVVILGVIFGLFKILSN